MGQPMMYTSVHLMAVVPRRIGKSVPRPTARIPATAGRSLTIRGFLLSDGHGKCPPLAPVLFELACTPAAVSRGDRPGDRVLWEARSPSSFAAARDGPLVTCQAPTIPRGMSPPLAWTDVRGKRKQQKRTL